MTPPALTAYRTKHRVVVVRDWSEDFGRFETVCETDGIRVYQVMGGRWYHHVSEIKELAARERGEPIDWARR